MRIADLYATDTLPVSFEIFPPKGELRPDEVRSLVARLKAADPAFISVTCSAGGTGGNSAKTAELAGIVENEFGVLSAAHVTCINSTKAEVDAAVEEVERRGIENVLALRGDRLEGREPTDFRYAAELIKYLKSRADTAGLCLGAGCYPEVHVECATMEEDVAHLREKQDAGAEFLLSQLFFSNESFFRFVEAARRGGVTLPIDAGIMPIMGKSQVTRMIFLCGASLPAPVVRMLAKYENSPDDLLKAAIDYASEQIRGIVESGTASGIHIYSMNKPDIAKKLAEAARGH